MKTRILFALIVMLLVVSGVAYAQGQDRSEKDCATGPQAGTIQIELDNELVGSKTISWWPFCTIDPSPVLVVSPSRSTSDFLPSHAFGKVISSFSGEVGIAFDKHMTGSYSVSFIVVGQQLPFD
jgi:hypothetical protein